MILPIYAGLERIPDSLLEASADLGGRGWTTFRRVILPLVDPGRRGGLDLHVLADPGRLHRPGAGLDDAVHRQRDLRQRRRAGPAARRGATRWSRSLIMLGLPARRPARSAPSRPSDAQRRARPDRAADRDRSLILAFIYIPLALVVVYAFNAQRHVRLAAGRLHARLVRAWRSRTPGSSRPS